ncbi:MAG: DNA cytosine methyltransferase, partial [Nanoarchaeota archaeon]|nr:DNA cytosine methyltransferase [Nanoarchaeota archaeon]
HFYNSTIQDYEWKRAKRLKEDHGYMGKMSFPEDINRPSRTVMATMSASTREAIIFNAIRSNKKAGYRLPTIREIACFMSFPITYQFEGKGESSKYKLIGNAVCCKLAAALADSIGKKEKIKLPDYIPQKIIKSSVDLTGKNHISKKPKSKKDDAKFAIHVPYIKIKSFRAEISNRDSDFKKNKIKWTSKLHYGSGKHANYVELKQNELEKALEKIKGFKKFKINLEKAFGQIKISAKDLQTSYILNGNSKEISPGKALAIIRKIINESFDTKTLRDINTLNKFSNQNLKRTEIPTLVLISLYACNYFIIQLKDN